jgi:Holliday junction resolvase
MGKKKGTRAERELFHMLWKSKFAVVRGAGSGSTPLPCPDLIAGNGKKVYAIECKSVKDSKKYFNVEEIKQLKEFSKKFGAIPLVGIRFDHKGWYFLEPKKLKKTSKMLMITFEMAKKKGFSFKDLIK